MTKSIKDSITNKEITTNEYKYSQAIVKGMNTNGN